MPEGLRRRLASPWTRVLVLVVAIGIAAMNAHRLPALDPLPALLGALPWIIGKYVLCPLRWHAISASGKPRRWHLKVYAESELMGLLTPAHSGADLWRAQQLHASAGMDRPAAFADVALDRLLGAIALAMFVVLAGTQLPPQVLLAAIGIAVVVLGAAYALRRRRPEAFAARPRPSVGKVVHGLLLSMAYQLSIVCLLLGGLAATGHTVAPLALLGVFGASQVAGIVPGVHGAGPREGALVAGLVALGVPFWSALGAVSITSIVAWGPALLLGGTCLLVRRARGHWHGMPTATPAAA